MTDSEPSSESSQVSVLRHVNSSYFKHLFFGEASIPVLLTEEWLELIGIPSPAFAVHVSHVFERSSEKQVIWLNTEPNVACVTDAHTLWDAICSVSEQPRKSMSREVLTVNGELPIAASVGGALPQPTFSGLINMFPKPPLIDLDGVCGYQDSHELMVPIHQKESSHETAAPGGSLIPAPYRTSNATKESNYVLG